MLQGEIRREYRKHELGDMNSVRHQRKHELGDMKSVRHKMKQEKNVLLALSFLCLSVSPTHRHAHTSVRVLAFKHFH